MPVHSVQEAKRARYLSGYYGEYGMSSAPSQRSRITWIADVALIAALYVVGAHLRLSFPFTAVGASWVWIPSGISWPRSSCAG